MATDINLTPTAGMPPVETLTQGTSSTSGTSGIVPSAGAAAATDQNVAALEQIAQAQGAVAPALAQQTEGAAAAKDAVAAEATRQAEEQAAIIKAKQPLIDAAKKAADEAEAVRQNHKFYDYMSTKSAGDRVLIRIASALEAAGNGLLGISGNSVMEKLSREIDRDFEKQKIALHSKEQAAQWRKDGVKDLYGQLQQELAANDVAHGKFNQAVAAKAEAMALRSGIPAEEAKNNVVTQTFNEKAKAKRLEAEQRYEKHFDQQAQKSASVQTTTAGRQGQPTESQAKDAVIGQQILDEVAKLEKAGPLPNDAMLRLQSNELAVESASATAEKGGVSGAVGNLIVGQGRKAGAIPASKYEGLTPEQQQTANSLDVMVELLARKFTGAGMPEKEARREAQSYGWAPGESADTMRAKLGRAKDIAMRTLSTTGQAGAAVAGAGKAQPAELADAVRWLAANPNDKRAPAVREKMRRKYGENAVRP